MSSAVPNRQIAEEAAEWAVLLDDRPLDAAERKRLADWLTASPAHVDELLYSASILAGLAGIDSERKLDIDALLAEAAPEVIPLLAERREPASPGLAQRTVGRWHRQAGRDPQVVRARWLALAASLVLLAVTGLVLSRLGPADPASPGAASRQVADLYATDVGEQRSITLADGSLIFLNTQSRLQVSYSAGERRIDLLRGEALFEVAHDERRAFRVYAGGTMTEAVGTTFNIKHTGGGIQVVVVEGRVLVDNRAATGRPPSSALSQRGDPERQLLADQALLQAGQAAQLSPAEAKPVVSDADLVTTTGWRMRQLSFDDAPLSHIAAEFNRYNRTPIVLADPSLSQTRLSGVFDANDPESFLAFLELSAGVRVDRSQPGRIVLDAYEP